MIKSFSPSCFIFKEPISPTVTPKKGRDRYAHKQPIHSLVMAGGNGDKVTGGPQDRGEIILFVL